MRTRAAMPRMGTNANRTSVSSQPFQNAIAKPTKKVLNALIYGTPEAVP